jgi:hypothetical protein
MGFGQLLSGILKGAAVAAVDAAPPAAPPHRYCLHCDVPFTAGPRCPGCGGPGIADRDPSGDSPLVDGTGG